MFGLGDKTKVFYAPFILTWLKRSRFFQGLTLKLHPTFHYHILVSDLATEYRKQKRGMNEEALN